MPPHAGRRHEQADEALAGKRDFHRIYGHAAAEERQRQAEDARHLRHLHPYLQISRGGGGQSDLDLKYEARAVPQRLTSKKAIDAWFELKTKALNNFQRAALRRRWATMEELMSAGERKQRIIASIIEDFSLKPRLNNDRGTAILVAASIYDACHYFRLFQNTPFGPFCGIITSYEPNHNAISREPGNSDERYKFDTYMKHVLGNDQTTKHYEDEAKRR